MGANIFLYFFNKFLTFIIYVGLNPLFFFWCLVFFCQTIVSILPQIMALFGEDDFAIIFFVWCVSVATAANVTSTRARELLMLAIILNILL